MVPPAVSVGPKGISLFRSVSTASEDSLALLRIFAVIRDRAGWGAY